MLLNEEELGRYLPKVIIPDTKQDCWVWIGASDPLGYGRFVLWRDGKPKRWLAHRVAYLHWRGTIPDHLVCDHLCRNPWCCNPWHIDLVTQQVNTLRGTAGDWQRVKTHCPKGHEYNEENTLLRNGGRWRGCRACSKAVGSAFRERARIAKTT